MDTDQVVPPIPTQKLVQDFFKEIGTGFGGICTLFDNLFVKTKNLEDRVAALEALAASNKRPRSE